MAAVATSNLAGWFVSNAERSESKRPRLGHGFVIFSISPSFGFMATGVNLTASIDRVH